MDEHTCARETWWEWGADMSTAANEAPAAGAIASDATTQTYASEPATYLRLSPTTT